MNTRLLIADDHAIVRGGLRQMLEQQADLSVVGEAVDGAQVLAALGEADIDVLLLDMNMPGLSGVELILRIKRQQPALPVLVLSMHNEPQVAARALKAGASGYVTKDSEPDTLLAAIRKVAGGGRYIVPELATQLVFDDGAAGPPHAQLSDRELEVLRLLVSGLGVSEIAGQLFISPKTVSTHKTRLMEKLGLGSTPALVRYAIDNDLA